MNWMDRCRPDAGPWATCACVQSYDAAALFVRRASQKSHLFGWVIWDLGQIPARGIEQVKEWYAGFPVKASACVECGVCVERCPFDVEIIAKMREAVARFETEAA